MSSKRKKQINCTFSKMKNFYASKDNIKKVKRPTKWQKIFPNHLSEKGLAFRIHKNL